MSSKNFDPFWYWINERHRIAIRKLNGNPWPWTDDEILQTYRFCNVFREWDTVTEWIRVNWREPYDTHPNLWFAMCVARAINWPDTLAELGFPISDWDPERAKTILHTRKERGDKVYTGAYMVRAEHVRGKIGYGMEKAIYICDVLLNEIWNDRENVVPQLTTVKQATEAISSHYGWGKFMAYEVATDLTHTRYLRNAYDINLWANAGPGAKRGLNRLHGRRTNKAMSEEQALNEMRELLEIANRHPSPLQAHVRLPLCLRDIEHSLCETDKYLRVKAGEGRPRSKYSHVSNSNQKCP